MTNGSLLAVALVMVVGAATPGPNNVLAMQAGARGVRAAARVIAGVLVGSSVLIAATWFGGGAVFTTRPWLHVALAVVSAGYLAWLGAVMMLGPAQRGTRTRLATSIAAVAGLQIVNPKAWMIALSVTTAPEAHGVRAFGEVIAICASISAACLAGWAAMGAALDRLLAARRRWVEVGSGMLLLVSAVVLLGEVVR